MKKLMSTVFVLGASCLVALSGCSGGGGGGGSTPVPTTVSSGTVTGFGSVFVNGVEYKTAGAKIHKPDDSISTTLGSSETEIQNHLRIGMQVRLKGSSNGTSVSALEIEFKDNLEGKVTAKTADSLTVLGITVKVDTSTKFDKSDTDTTMTAFMDSIVPGTSWVEVSGLPDNTGTLIATFIEDKAPGDVQELKGYIVSSTASSFDLGLTAGITSVTINQVLPPGITIGSYVEVKYDAAGTFIKVEIEDDLVTGDANTAKAEAEGYVSVINANDMTVLVNGSPETVVLAATTVYYFKLENGVLAPAAKTDLKIGQKVSAEGPISAGAIIAEKVKIRTNLN